MLSWVFLLLFSRFNYNKGSAHHPSTVAFMKGAIDTSSLLQNEGGPPQNSYYTQQQEVQAVEEKKLRDPVCMPALRDSLPLLLTGASSIGFTCITSDSSSSGSTNTRPHSC